MAWANCAYVALDYTIDTRPISILKWKKRFVSRSQTNNKTKALNNANLCTLVGSATKNWPLAVNPRASDTTAVEKLYHHYSATTGIEVVGQPGTQ